MDMSIYDSNINVMKDRYPDIVGYLNLDRAKKPILEDEKGITVGVQDVSGKSVMCVQKGTHIYQFDSMYDSDGLLDIWFDSLGDRWDLNAILLMYGLGNGMYVRKFLERARADCSVVIHEPSEKMFVAAIENFDLTWLFTDKRARLVFWPVYKEREDIFVYYHKKVFSYAGLGSQKAAFYMNYPRIFEKDIDEFITGINDARDAVEADQVVFDRFGEDYNRNTFNNIKYMPDSLSYCDLVKKMPEDIPAIVVAAGPSLDKNINELKAAKGKSLIIATDTALKPLALAGIIPDLAAIMDGKKDARYMSEETSKHVPMICTPRSGDTFLDLHKGPKIFTDYFCEHIKYFMDSEGIVFTHLSAGGSVANSCFEIAENLHCSRIILVGQDLAYTGDKTHSAVTVRGSIPTKVEDLEHPVMAVDIDGNPIRTSLEFKSYKQWFEHEIKTHPELTVIDATEGGIRIEGTELMTLREAINRECKVNFDFDKVIGSVDNLFPYDKRQKFIEYVTEIPKELHILQNKINAVLDDYIEMEKLIRQNKYNTTKFRSLYNSSQRLGEDIENTRVVEYVRIQLQTRASHMLENINKLEDDEKTELLSVCDIGKKYLNDMLDALHELEPYVDSMRSDLVKVGEKA